MSQPFYQPARQNFSSSQSMQQPQGGFGGFGGGYQMPQQSFGGGFGGGYGSGFGFGGGFQPSFGGGYGSGFSGGFQPQQQFNPFQGGFGGGFSPFQGGFGGGFGGGFNPMFGGIGGLGFNPMMGPQFGMPMQGMDDPISFAKQPSTQEEWAYATRNAVDSPFVNGRYNPMMGPQFGMPMQGFDPYQQQPQDFGSFDMMYRGGPQMSPEMQQRREQNMRNMERMANSQRPQPAPWMPTITETPGFGDWQQKQKQWVDQTPEGISYTKANEALEAFKKANPNASSYSGYWADPALKAQYDKIYGDYQSGTQTYFNKLNEYEKTNPFSPTAQQPQSPFTGPQRSAQDILSMAVGKTPQDMQYDLNKDGKITAADALAYQRQYGQQPQTPVDSGMNRGVDNMSIGPGFGSRQPMYGGLGSLGFNPMMGPQFGMPMKQVQRSQYENPQQRQVAEAEKARWASLTPEQRSDENNALRARFQQEYSPIMGPQFGMPMLQGMQANSPQGRVAMGSLGGMNIQPLSAEQQQLLNQLPQQTQASPSGDSFARLAQMFSGRTPQNSSEPQQPAPPGMKWMLGYGGYSLVPEGLDTSVMG